MPSDPSPASERAVSASGRFLARLAAFETGALMLAGLAWIAFVSVFFLLFPAVDLATTGLFHDPQQGFRAATTPALMRLRELGPFLVRFIAICSLLLVLVAAFWPAAGRRIALRPPLFLITTLALGPGLLVNAILKNNWGRPRPVMVEAFGGDAPYVSVWRITDHCGTNCSFVSGEGSASFWLFSLVFLVPARWRATTALLIAPLCLALSANRVAFGGHFLSDTLMAWGLTLLVILAMRHLFWEVRGAEARARRWRAGFDRAAAALRRGISRVAGSCRAAFRRFFERFA
uniref:phosphatase PAP2 family protein n=1 Tax=Stappia sp. TaxID=1870903 RepID=UPI003BAC1ADB